MCQSIGQASDSSLRPDTSDAALYVARPFACASFGCISSTSSNGTQAHQHTARPSTHRQAGTGQQGRYLKGMPEMKPDATTKAERRR